MANSALIDDLERQFADNPRRVFARLANEYRKIGDLERAIAYCRAHIPQAPNYISGYIVLGQALYDGRRYEEARQTFETALNLDPENVIALRQLGDIAVESGDADGARGWYHRLLEVDPQNEDVLAQLESIKPPTDVAVSAQELAEGAEWGTIPFDPGAIRAFTPLGSDAIGPALTPSDAVAEHEPLDESVSLEEEFAAGAFYTTEPALDDLALREQADAGVRNAGIDQAADDAHGLSDLDPWAEATPDAAAPADELPASIETYGMIESFAVDEEPEEVVAPTYDASIGRTVEPDGDEDLPAAPAFVTETMADLYLQQGFTGEAIAIYRQLLAQRPDDAELRERLARIEGGDVGATSGDDASEGGVPAMRPDVAASSARSFFRALGSRRPPRSRNGSNGGHAGGAGGASLFGDALVNGADDDAARTLAGAFSEEYRQPSDGADAEPTAGALSLDEVFRGSPPAGTATPTEGRMSYDEFFGGAASTQGSNGHGEPDATQPEKQDIDQFHAWLDGLKK